MSQDLGFKPAFWWPGAARSHCPGPKQTVDALRHVHSVHGYFLRPAMPPADHLPGWIPCVNGWQFYYHRRVQAIQKGKPDLHHDLPPSRR